MKMWKWWLFVDTTHRWQIPLSRRPTRAQNSNIIIIIHLIRSYHHIHSISIVRPPYLFRIIQSVTQLETTKLNPPAITFFFFTKVLKLNPILITHPLAHIRLCTWCLHKAHEHHTFSSIFPYSIQIKWLFHDDAHDSDDDDVNDDDDDDDSAKLVLGSLIGKPSNSWQ